MSDINKVREILTKCIKHIEACKWTVLNKKPPYERIAISYDEIISALSSAFPHLDREPYLRERAPKSADTVTREHVSEVRELADNTNLTYEKIAQQTNLNIGRVSDILAGKYDHL